MSVHDAPPIAAARCLARLVAPAPEAGQRVVAEIALEMHQRAELAGVDHPLDLGLRQAVALVVAEAEPHPRRLDRADRAPGVGERQRSEEHTSELQSLMRISYAVLCLKT